jgi:glycosyltransferase involved in cell wall biosynthesis
MSNKRIYYTFFHDTDFVPIHAAEVIEAMIRQGHRVDLFAFRNVVSALGEAAATGRLKVHVIWAPRLRFVAELCFVALLMPVLLARMLFQKPDLIYVRHSGVSIAAAWAARLAGVPCAIEINDIPHDKLLFAGASRLKIAWVEMYHRLSLPLATKVFPVTAPIGTWLADYYHVKAGRIQVIPNGVNTSRFLPRDRNEARRRFGVPAEVPVLVCLGSLFPWAGMETMLEALPKIIAVHPNVHVAIGSGEEPYLGEIKTKVAAKGLGAHFSFAGFIPWDDASWYISMADCCVAPFIFKNIRSGVCSLRVLSYLACGKPVVGSDIPGLGDMLEHEGVGRSFPMEDQHALACTVNDLLSDPAVLTAMGKRARLLTEREYAWESIVQRIMRVADGKDGL